MLKYLGFAAAAGVCLLSDGLLGVNAKLWNDRVAPRGVQSTPVQARHSKRAPSHEKDWRYLTNKTTREYNQCL
jgi:hypothetical protein